MSEINWKSQLKSLHSVEPEVAWEIIQKIRVDNGGVCSPQHVVDAARPDDSPLHKAFEWDDSVAAEGYRKAQARQIVRNFELVFDNGGTGPALVSVRVGHGNESRRGYMNTDEALNDGDLRKQVLKTALSQMLSMQSRFKTLSELSGVWSAIHSIAEEHAIEL